MHKPIELRVDVTDAADSGVLMETAATVFLPEGALSDPPVVCFLFPGAGYGRRYFSFDMPDSAGEGGEAGFHCNRGWIVVACDHLGVGDSSVPEDDSLSFEIIARANDATVQAVMQRLECGTLLHGFPRINNATKLGVGQSMGGCFTIVAQGQLSTFDGVAVLGFSGIHTVVPPRPGTPAAAWPWIPRGSALIDPKIMNRRGLGAADIKGGFGDRVKPDSSAEHPLAWCFHYDGEPADIVALDMAAVAGAADPLPEWRSATMPMCRMYMVAPGVVAVEAASITVPVLAAVGERDIVPDPWMEPKAYKSATDISVFICPRMAHMHNFARTRHRFWQRIHAWGSGVAQTQAFVHRIGAIP
jgi:pimeloyl-ACP methyl ester carboxylesterase